MIWRGKALGALIGVFAAGPAGALFGAVVGHLFDAHSEGGGNEGGWTAADEPDPQIAETYFRTVFQVMGRLAKADGRVSEQEIGAARAVMNQLRLGERETRSAMELFREGKGPDFSLDAALLELRRQCAGRSDLLRMFVQIQMQVALWGNSLDPAGRQVLSRVCAALDVSSFELLQMEALLRMQQSFSRPQTSAPADDAIAQAYKVLGVPRGASDADVTRAYRRLMNQNHPDKLHAKGLPEPMMRLAAEKTRQIRAAYELLREARGMRA